MNIRFRVFDEGVMYYPEKEHTLYPDYVIGPRGSVWQQTGGGLCELPCPAMLSTGHEDKNGRECFADDIVSVKHTDGEVVKCLIYWCKGHGLAMKELDGWDPLTKYGPLRTAPGTEWTYLGNKHENEDLLEMIKK